MNQGKKCDVPLFTSKRKKVREFIQNMNQKLEKKRARDKVRRGRFGGMLGGKTARLKSRLETVQGSEKEKHMCD